MNSGAEVLSVASLSYSYKGEKSVALEDIDLTIYKGEAVAIVGPSGAGKSTLLRTLHEKFRDSSMVHQEFLLVPQLSLFHNVFMGRLDYFNTFYNLLNLIFPQRARKEEIRTITKELDIDSLLHKRCRLLSGGEQQRTAIARALYRNAAICFADEPVSAMDPENAHKTLLLLRNSGTVIASMHNTELAQKYFSRIVGLKAGKILFDLPAEKISQSTLDTLYKA